jgi:transcriptional regulator of acetoin/glycerol metabolism
VQLKSEKKIKGIGREAMDVLMAYDWPGNVRELKGAFEYAFVACQDEWIRPEDLPPDLFQQRPILQKPESSELSRDETKKRQLIRALEKTNGNQTKAAQILGVTRVTIWNRMKRYGLSSKPNYRVQRDQN